TEIVRAINAHLQRHIGSLAEVMIASQAASGSFVTSIIPTSAGPDAVAHLTASFSRELLESTDLSHWSVEPVSVVTAIGDGINALPKLTGQVIGALGELPLLGISVGAGGCSLSLVVHASDSDNALRQLHQAAVS